MSSDAKCASFVVGLLCHSARYATASSKWQTTVGDFTFAGMTLANGKMDGDNESFSDNTYDGGAIRSLTTGIMTVENSDIVNNSTSGRFTSGGGLFAMGPLIVRSSAIVGNSAHADGNHRSAYGGGIWADGDVEIIACTLSANTADFGGSVSARGNVTLTSSTISGNSAAYDGGGIHADGEVTVTSSTIAGNSAVRRGGGIYADSVDQVTIADSIVALNTDAGTAPDLDVGGGTLSVQYSLIGDNTGTDLTEAPVGSPNVNGNLIGGTVAGTIDPFLAPLADNGGPTHTLALLAGSPAIDAGDPAAMAGADEVPLYDQRGEPYARVTSGNGTARIDIGSYEQQSLQGEILAVASPTTTAVDEVTIQFSSPVSGFDVADLKLSLNGGVNLLTSSHTLSTNDDQAFVLGGLADITAAGGYYTLQLIAPGSQIVDANGGESSSGARLRRPHHFRLAAAACTFGKNQPGQSPESNPFIFRSSTRCPSQHKQKHAAHAQQEER